MWKLATTFVLLATGLALYMRASRVVDLPTLSETFWGPEGSKTVSTDIRPFKIDVPKSVIEDLHRRLKGRRPFVQPLEGTSWTYGISTKYLEKILDYWQNKYNWAERQDLLNKYPQYITNIQGLDIHYYHVRPANNSQYASKKVLPLLLLHGWPGSVVEFQKLIPMLTTPRTEENFVFEVIIPSLPGYGFSHGAVRPGLNAAEISVIMKNLMQRLGFKKFYIHGGDWGSVIVTNLAILFPNNTLGVHSTMCEVLSTTPWLWMFVASYFPSLVGYEYYNQMYPLTDYISLLLEESGYMHIQATKPDTIGTALSASPEGLAAYILEKFSTWTNKTYRERHDGGLTEKFTLDELLDNVMIYWITNSMTTSARLYAEFFSKKSLALKMDELPVNVPAACAAFPNEILYKPESLIRNKYPHLIQFNYMLRGGHFAAFEEPLLLSNDIYDFVKKVENMAHK